MTSRPVPRKPSVPTEERFNPPPRVPVDPRDGKFPVFPPRGDMQNPIHLHDPGYQGTLRRHFGSPETTIVLGEVPVGRNLGQRRGLRVPDLLIAFGVDRRRIIADRGYSIEQWGKPPDFVLEIASETTAENDVTGKREDYAAFGVPEYWRFDPSGGLYYETGLAGDRLIGGVYQPVRVEMVDESHYWGRSEVLRLDLCWEEGRLRWYDPVARRYLLTFDEEVEAHISALEQRDAALEQRDAERASRLAAEERIREMEAEIRRLRS